MTADEDFGFGSLDHCPACGSHELLAVHDEEQANFLCEACDRCWHLALGWAQRVDPESCRACAERGRCLAVSDGSDRLGVSGRARRFEREEEKWDMAAGEEFLDDLGVAGIEDLTPDDGDEVDVQGVRRDENLIGRRADA